MMAKITMMFDVDIDVPEGTPQEQLKEFESLYNDIIKSLPSELGAEHVFTTIDRDGNDNDRSCVVSHVGNGKYLVVGDDKIKSLLDVLGLDMI